MKNFKIIIERVHKEEHWMKNKNLTKIVAMAIIGSMCMMTTACSVAQGDQVSQTRQKSEVKTESIKIDKAYLKGKINYPVISNLNNKDVESTINDFLKKDVSDFIKGQDEYCKSIYEKDEENYKKRNIKYQYERTYQDDHIVSLKIENILKDKNEEKPFVMKDFYTFDLRTGKRVYLYKLFDSKENYKQVIKEVAEEQLRKDEKNYVVKKISINDDQYYIKDKHIVVHVDGYKISPEEHDDYTFEIPFRAFKYGVNTEVKLEPSFVKVESKLDTKDEKYFESSMRIPIILGLRDTKVQDKINKMFEKDAIDFIKQIEEYSKEGAEDAKKYDYEMRPCYANVDFEIKENRKDRISVYVYYHQFTGGAHGNTDCVTYNIDLKTGEMIELKDLFKDGYDYKKAIDEKIQKQIDDIAKDAKESALRRGEDAENVYIQYDAFEGIREDHTFYLKEDRIGIYFGLYEIASYAEGIPTFEIPVSEMKDGLKEKYIK